MTEQRMRKSSSQQLTRNNEDKVEAHNLKQSLGKINAAAKGSIVLEYQ